MVLTQPYLRRGTKLIGLALAWIGLGTGAATGANAVLRPFHLYDDFSGNTLSQWACYPAVQDVGYNPSLSPTSEFGAIGGRSLMRVVRPPSTGRLRFGFIKKLDTVATNPIKLSFSYRLTIGTPAVIEVGLAGENGQLYATHFEANSNAWNNSSLQFRDIPTGLRLEALYITATFKHGNPDADYRFLLDNVSLEAAEEASFEVEMPKATAIFPWTSLISSSTYSPGETIAIRAKAPVRLTNVECVLKDQDRQTITTSEMKLESGIWTNHSIHTVSESDPLGVWHAELRGTTADGRSVHTDVRFLVRPARSETHPRLFFGAAGRSALLARTRESGLEPAWSHLTALARSSRETGDITAGGQIFQLLDRRYLLPTLPGYFDVVNRASDRLLYNALEGYVTDDRDARSVAKSALLAVAGWSTWAPPWFQAHGQFTYYPAGELTSAVAFAYDVLYDDLSESERNLVRRALITHGIKAAYEEYVLDNRIMVNTSNWIGHAVGGAIVAAMAVLPHDDDPELNTYLGGLLMKFEDHLAASYLSDGSYGEGISYQEFDLKTSTLALAALQRVCGINYWNRSYVKESLEYPLYTLAHPLHDSLDMGDSHPPSGYSIAGVIEHSNDPVMHWYYDQFEHRSINDFLFPPQSVSPKPPSEPVSRIFDQKGDAVFRTGWAPDDTVLLFRAGPNFNHNHADQGSFLLRALGEGFAVEGGYSDYYKDPYYASYFSQAAAHNTILVDGDPASQDIADTPQFRALHSYPRITDSVTSDFYDAVGSELSSVYKGKLKRYTRRVVFVKPGYVIVYDSLTAEESTAKFDWLLHVASRDRLRSIPSGMIYQGVNASMGVRALQPESSDIKIQDGHIPYAVFNPTAPRTLPAEPGIVDIGSRAESGSAHFLVLLTMARTSAEAAAAASAAKAISSDGCIGMRLGNDEVLFRADRAPSVQCGEWRTDASAWTSTGPIISAELVTTLAKAGKLVFQSDSPVNFAARYGDGTVNLVTSADRPATVHFHTGFRPAGISDSDYNSREQTVELTVPARRMQITLEAPH
ncbi:MAG TPA: heparinase II/III family protein [Bryobacteraceae bacterium]